MIGIRKEDKSRWERRTPLVPQDVRELVEMGYKIIVEPSPIRVFPDEEYRKAGAILSEDLSGADIILGVKEIPPSKLLPQKVYMYFSHTIKGQPYNMPMLRRLLELGDTLIDYERIVDDRGRRLIFFGTFAGYAGAIDTLWALGKRLQAEGLETPFSRIKQAYQYSSLEEAKREIASVGREIQEKGIDGELLPFVIGIAGYGNVSKGAQEIIDLLPTREVQPEELHALKGDNRTIYKVVFKEWHMVEPLEGKFELQDYYQHPEKYRGVFSKYLPYLTVLINAIYWDSRYPRLVTKEQLRELYSKEAKLKVIGDISCDIEGAVEATVKCTEPDEPVFLYHVDRQEALREFTGKGPLILAVDILPSELPKESSLHFSSVLKKFIPAVAEASYTVPFERLALPPELKRAVIVYRGELTPDYQYLKKYL